MVKIQDPRRDRSGIALRILRLEKASKYIKKKISRNNYDKVKFNEERLGLEKYDEEFYEEFKQCSEEIKKELIFLWEEVYDLNQKIDYFQNKLFNKNEKSETSNELNFTEDNSQEKITYIFGPPPPPPPPPLPPTASSAPTPAHPPSPSTPLLPSPHQCRPALGP